MAKPKDITNVRSGKLVALERGYKYGITYKCIYHRYRRGKRGDDLVRC